MRCAACERTVVPGYEGAALGGGACYHIMCRECRDHYPNCPECGHGLKPEVPLDKSAYLDSVLVTFVMRNKLRTFEAVSAAIRKEWEHNVDGLPDTPLFRLLTPVTWPQFIDRCKKMDMERESAMTRAGSALQNHLTDSGPEDDQGRKRARVDDGAASAAAGAAGPAPGKTQVALLTMATGKTRVVVGNITIQVANYPSPCKTCKFRPNPQVNSVCKAPQGWICVKCAFGVPETVENLKKIASGAPFKGPTQQRKAGAAVTTSRKQVPVPKGLEIEF